MTVAIISDEDLRKMDACVYLASDSPDFIRDFHRVTARLRAAEAELRDLKGTDNASSSR